HQIHAPEFARVRKTKLVRVIQLKQEVHPAVGVVRRVVRHDVQPPSHFQVDDQRVRVELDHDVLPAPVNRADRLVRDPRREDRPVRNDQAARVIVLHADDRAPGERFAQAAHDRFDFGEFRHSGVPFIGRASLHPAFSIQPRARVYPVWVRSSNIHAILTEVLPHRETKSCYSKRQADRTPAHVAGSRSRPLYGDSVAKGEGMPKTLTVEANGNTVARYYVILSDRLSVAALAFTWVILLVAYVRAARRTRQLERRLAAVGQRSAVIDSNARRTAQPLTLTRCSSLFYRCFWLLFAVLRTRLNRPADTVRSCGPTRSARPADRRPRATAQSASPDGSTRSYPAQTRARPG